MVGEIKVSSLHFFLVMFFFLPIKDSHPCDQNNGFCSDFCLLKPEGYQCACPTGIALKSDGKNCENGENAYFFSFNFIQTLLLFKIQSINSGARRA